MRNYDIQLPQLKTNKDIKLFFLLKIYMKNFNLYKFNIKF